MICAKCGPPLVSAINQIDGICGYAALNVRRGWHLIQLPCSSVVVWNHLYASTMMNLQAFLLVIGLALTQCPLCGYALSRQQQSRPPPGLEHEIPARSNPGLISTYTELKLGGDLRGRFLHITDIVRLVSLFGKSTMSINPDAKPSYICF